MYGLHLSRLAGEPWLHIEGTDLRQFLAVRVPASGPGTLDVVVGNPANFVSLVRTVDAEDIDLEATSLGLKFVAGRHRSIIKADAKADFPQAPELPFDEDHGDSFDVVMLAEQVRDLAAARFAAEKATRTQVSILANTHLAVDVERGLTTLTSRNGVHAAVSKCASEPKRQVSAVIPADAWDAVEQMAHNAERFLISFSENKVAFAAYNGTSCTAVYTIQAVSAMYPASKALTPIEATDPQIEIPTEHLRDAMKTIQLFEGDQIELEALSTMVITRVTTQAGDAIRIIDGTGSAVAKATVAASNFVKAVQNLTGTTAKIGFYSDRIKVESGNLLYAMMATG